MAEGLENDKIWSEMEEESDDNSFDKQEETEKRKCTFCKKNLKAREKRKHEKVCLKAVLKYHCHICNRCFKHSGTLNGHIKRHNAPGGFVCRYCGDRFCSEEARIKHREEKHKVFKCQVCKGLFETTESYLDHVVKEHDGRDREYYICENCGQQFKSPMQLNTHKQSKCGTEKFFKCDECGLKYMTQATLNAHKYIHKGEKLHCCAFCGKSFLSKGQLTVHERKHTGEKPYQCTLCDKSFSYRESLVTHSSIHTGVKPYICECCHSRFSCIGNLLKHRRARPASCGLPQFDKNVKAAPRASSKVPGSLTMNTIRIKPTKVLNDKVGKKKSKIKSSGKKEDQQEEPEQVLTNPNRMVENEIRVIDQKILMLPQTITGMETKTETEKNNEVDINEERVEYINVEVFGDIDENDDDFVTKGSHKRIKLFIRSKDELDLGIQDFQENHNKTDHNDNGTIHIIETDDTIIQSTNNHINSFQNAVVEELCVHLEDNCDKIVVNQAQCMETFTDISCDGDDVGHFIQTDDAVYTIIEKDENEIINEIHSPNIVESYASNEETPDVLEDMADSNFESENDNINDGENVKIELYDELGPQSGECSDPEWIYNPPSPTFDEEINNSEQEDVKEEKKNKKQRKRRSSENKYVCPICPKRYRHRTTFTKHIQNHHELINLDLEYRSDDSMSGTKCQYCDKTYLIKACLEKHEAEHGPDGKLIHKCSFCKLYFETAKEAAKHTKETHADRTTCDICHGVYAGKESLSGHKRYAHPKNTSSAPVKPAKQKTFICPKCGKKFSTRTILSDHERSDCGKAPLYKCTVCDKSYHSLGSLKTHQTVHTGDLPFLCYCGKAFRTQGQVRVHQRSHSGEKPFKCEMCPKAFAYRESLLTHVSMHTGIRRFLCQTCGLRFSCISNLQAHRRARKLTCGAQPNMTKPVGGVMGVSGGSLYVGAKESSG